jgi:hypothetical protein
MTRRIENRTERKVHVKWTTVEWEPQIEIVPGNRKSEQNRVEMLDFPLDRPKPRKRRQVTVLWVRGGARNGLNGKNGARPTWR